MVIQQAVMGHYINNHAGIELSVWFTGSIITVIRGYSKTLDVGRRGYIYISNGLSI